MKSKIYLIMVSLILLAACSKKNNSPEKEFSYSDFENSLKSDMSYNSIIEKFGEPSKDIGSGIHIYVYKLIDSTEIWIGFIDRILYARQMDKNQKVLNIIIEDNANPN